MTQEKLLQARSATQDHRKDADKLYLAALMCSMIFSQRPTTVYSEIWVELPYPDTQNFGFSHIQPQLHFDLRLILSFWKFFGPPEISGLFCSVQVLNYAGGRYN